MKKRIYIVVCLVLLCFVAAYLPFPAEAAGKEPYKIGAILPLTGPLSWLGGLAHECTQLKVEMINKTGE